MKETPMCFLRVKLSKSQIGSKTQVKGARSAPFTWVLEHLERALYALNARLRSTKHAYRSLQKYATYFCKDPKAMRNPPSRGSLETLQTAFSIMFQTCG